MKKLLSVLLAIAMMTCMIFTTAAASTIDVANGENSTTISIKLKTNDGGTTTSAPKVYYVTVDWQNTNLSYIAGGADQVVVNTWDPINHKYTVTVEGTDTPAAGAWENDGKYTVTVTNHSNAQVIVNMTVPVAQSGVTFTADATHATLADASIVALDKPNSAEKVVFTVTATGIPLGDFTTDAKVALQ